MPLDEDLLNLLVGLLQHHRPPGHYVVIPQSVDPSGLLMCPLRTRTKNCLQRAIVRQVLHGENRVATVDELLVLPNLGILSLLDLMCIVEAALDSGYLSARPSTATDPPLEPEHDRAPAPEENPGDASAQPDDGTEAPTAAWNSATLLLARVLGASMDFRGARTLGDALRCDLAGLATTLGLTADLDRIPISDLVRGPTLAETVVLAIVAWQESESVSSVERLILERRILTPEPATLEEIARGVDLTRERIRQLEKPLRGAVESTIGHPITVIATLMGEQLGPIASESGLEERISSTFPATVSPNADESAVDVARHLLREQLGYSGIDGISLSPDATAVRDSLREAARSLTDDAGLIDEESLRSHLPDDSWQQHWDALIDRCDLHRLGGRLALRDTAKARAKAALLTIGRPATKEEVAALCELPPDRASAQLSLLPSVARADKVRWGLAEWIDDVYEGIPAEIIQRIDEDGGSTRLERLLEELPRLFGVNENSVRSYVGTPRFELSEGYVSLADESSIALRPLDDVVDGRLASGAPYWCFKVEDRYFNGYSVAGVPPEIVKSLGCKPDDRTQVWISSPPGCRPLSVNWPLASVGGPSLGYLSEPLRRLDACVGDRVRLVLEGSGYASLHLDRADESAPEARGNGNPPHDPSPGAPPAADRARELLERMTNRRRGF